MLKWMNITFFSCFNDFVVNVCVVSDVCDIVSFIFKITSKEVEENALHSVAKVWGFIWGYSTAVDAYFAFLDRFEFFFLSS